MFRDSGVQLVSTSGPWIALTLVTVPIMEEKKEKFSLRENCVGPQLTRNHYTFLYFSSKLQSQWYKCFIKIKHRT